VEAAQRRTSQLETQTPMQQMTIKESKQFVFKKKTLVNGLISKIQQ
jgi:uncharacterized coiled-coil protein SlyX